MKLSPRARRRTLLAALVVGLCIAGGVYWHQKQAAALADRAMGDIPKDEYEAWMQDLGYVD